MSKEFIQKEAPLSQESYTVDDHVDLIKRGYKTEYTIVFDRKKFHQKKIEIKKVRFGFPYFEDKEKIEMSLSIIGLPPKKGTHVLVFGYVEEDTDGITHDEIQVFSDVEDVEKFIKEESAYLLDVFKDIGYELNLKADEMISKLLQNKYVDNLFLKLLQLP